MIKDIMTNKIICADINSTIYEVSNLMKKYNIGFIPIKKDNELVGVITDRDIVVKAISNNSNSDDLIKDYVSNNIKFVDINSNITEALNIMGTNQIKRLVVKKDNKPIGVLSLSDIINNTDENVIDTLKSIWKLQNNTLNDSAEVDEFYL